MRLHWQAGHGAGPRDPDVAVTYCNPDDPLLRRALIRSIELLTGQRKINRLYRSYRAEGPRRETFWADAVERLSLNIRYDQERLSKVPRTGPLLVVSNHPYGVLDGLGLCYLVSRVRPDLKFLAHATFSRAPELEPYLMPIYFDGASAALRSNVSARKLALSHLDAGGAIVVFPAGRVSTAPRVFDKATDAPWKLFCATMIQRSRARILPVHFEGQNSWVFHLASVFSEALREALLLGEVRKRIGAEIMVNIGRTIDFAEVEEMRDRQGLLDFLRAEVYQLAQENGAV